MKRRRAKRSWKESRKAWSSASPQCRETKGSLATGDRYHAIRLPLCLLASFPAGELCLINNIGGFRFRACFIGGVRTKYGAYSYRDQSRQREQGHGLVEQKHRCHR